MRPMNLALAGVALAASVSSAQADCAADFKRSNALRKEAGRFEVKTEAEIMNQKGRVLKRIAASSQYDLSDGVRMRTSNLSSQTDFIIVRDKGWNRAAGTWTPMPAEQLSAALAGLSAKSYVHDADVKKVECAGALAFEGKDYLAFRYEQEVKGYPTRATAYFDKASRLPVASVASIAISDFTNTITTLFRFDPAIRIETPQ